MKKVFIMFLVFFYILFTVQEVSAEEETGPPVSIVEKFEPYSLELLQDGAFYVGVFMDEAEYSFYTRLKIEYNYISDKLKIFEKYSEGLDKIVEDHNILSNSMLKDMSEVKKMVENAKESWWDQNKFYIGVTAGAIITGLIIAGANAL